MHHMVPMWFHINNQKEIKHMATHVILHKISSWLSHKLICESQCTMTKLNYEILLKNKSLNLPIKLIT
jgi:hypothetical protein